MTKSRYQVFLEPSLVEKVKKAVGSAGAILRTDGELISLVFDEYLEHVNKTKLTVYIMKQQLETFRNSSETLKTSVNEYDMELTKVNKLREQLEVENKQLKKKVEELLRYENKTKHGKKRRK